MSWRARRPRWSASRFAFRGVAALLIGLGGGGDDALPLAIVTVVSMTLAVATYAGLCADATMLEAPSLRRPMTRECATEAL